MTFDDPASISAPLPRGVMIAAPRSGAGKTTVTLGLLRALTRRGLQVQPFKCGPDYIDPAFHSVASRRTSFNVDSWAMRGALVDDLLARSIGADAVICEALMGLFDGVARTGQWGDGASADIAARTGWPVILVIDVAGQSQTAAAVVRGFQGFRDGVSIAGVILNRIGSERHQRYASDAIAALGIPVLGALPRDPSVLLPERHLGLVQAGETADIETRLDGLSDFIEAHVDIDRLFALMVAGQRASSVFQPPQPPGQRIALARDEAFSFIYPHVIEGWRAAGAEIVPFSPLADEAPDSGCDVIWLPGGYPELHAGVLANAGRFKAGVRAFAQSRPVHGECGGYMVMGRSLIDADGVSHEMLALLGLETSFAKRKMTLGYRNAKFLSSCAAGGAGERIFGHEFHYASIIEAPDEALFELQNAEGALIGYQGSRRGLATGSFFHFIDKVAD
jgi:cobyrinic acid a,c-diamide synthase